MRIFATLRGRFAAIEFLTSELQCTQMLAAAGKLHVLITLPAPSSPANALKKTPKKLQSQQRKQVGGVVEVGSKGEFVVGVESGEDEKGLQDSEKLLLRYFKSMVESCGGVGEGVTGSSVLQKATEYAVETLGSLPRDYLGESVLSANCLSEEHVQMLAEVRVYLMWGKGTGV